MNYKDKLKRKSAGLMLVLGICCLVSLSVSAKTFTMKQDGFQLNLPDDWTQVPQKVLQKKNKELAREDKKMVYDYAFQVKERDSLRLPYILVRINNERRVSKDNIAKINQSIIKNMEQAQNSKRFNVNILQKKKIPQKHMFLVRSDFTSKSKWDIRIDYAQFYTQKGILQFSFFCSRKEVPQYEPHFLKAVKNLQLAPGMEYEETWTEKWNIRKWVGSWSGIITITLVLGILLLFILYLLSSRSKN